MPDRVNICCGHAACQRVVAEAIASAETPRATARPHHWINQNGRCDNGQMMDQGDNWKPVYLEPPTPPAAPTPVSYAIEVLYNPGSHGERWALWDEFDQSPDREEAERERTLMLEEDGHPAEHVRVVGLVIV